MEKVMPHIILFIFRVDWNAVAADVITWVIVGALPAIAIFIYRYDRARTKETIRRELWQQQTLNLQEKTANEQARTNDRLQTLQERVDKHGHTLQKHTQEISKLDFQINGKKRSNQ